MSEIDYTGADVHNYDYVLIVSGIQLIVYIVWEMAYINGLIVL